LNTMFEIITLLPDLQRVSPEMTSIPENTKLKS
jgi:hypothetical protein